MTPADRRAAFLLACEKRQASCRHYGEEEADWARCVWCVIDEALAQLEAEAKDG